MLPNKEKTQVKNKYLKCVKAQYCPLKELHHVISFIMNGGFCSASYSVSGA